jgi:hypothetical protein
MYPLILLPGERWNNRIASVCEVPKKNRGGGHHAVTLQYYQAASHCTAL